MRKLCALGLMVIGVLAIGAGRASAQEPNVIKLMPIFQASESFQDNVTLTSGPKIHDFVSTFLAGGYLGLTGPDRNGALSYLTTGQVYADHSQFNNFLATHFLSLNDQEHLSSLTNLSINDSLVIGSPTTGVFNGAQPNLNSQLAQAALNGGQSTSNYFAASMDHRFSGPWSIQGTVNQSTFSTSSQISFLQGGTVQTAYQFSRKLSLGVAYTFNDFRNDIPSQPASESHFMQGTGQWQITRGWSVSGTAGIIVIDGLGSGGTQGKPGGHADITYKSRRWQIDVSGGQTPSVSAGFGGGGTTLTGSGQFSYQLAKRVSAYVGSGYYQFTGSGSDLYALSYGAGVIAEPYKWLSIYANYLGFRTENNGTPLPQTPANLPIGTQAISNAYTIGARVSFEAFHWSWH